MRALHLIAGRAPARESADASCGCGYPELVLRGQSTRLTREMLAFTSRTFDQCHIAPETIYGRLPLVLMWKELTDHSGLPPNRNRQHLETAVLGKSNALGGWFRAVTVNLAFGTEN